MTDTIMTPFRKINALLSVAIATIGVAATVVPAEEGGEPVVICLAESVELESDLVMLADLMIPEQAATQAVRMFGTIDVLQRSGVEALAIPRDLIELRLRLAGYTADEVLLVGPERVMVQASHAQVAIAPMVKAVAPPAIAVTQTTGRSTKTTFHAAEIEVAAALTIAAQLSLPAEELRVTLTSSLTGLATTPAMPTESRRCEVIPLGDRLLGRIGCFVRLFDGPRLVRTWNATLLVERRCQVLVASRSLERGATVDSDALHEELRFLTEAVDELSLPLVVGRQVRSTIRPGQILALRQLESGVQPSSEIVIQPRQVVQVTAIRPGLQVRLRQAQALDGGRVGDVIRMRNDDSGRIISGRVSGPGTVEIALE
ncbi:MAG: flagellar basal body P-ring formation chaperone FlgA [Planctomycetaceae bacterium]